MQKVSMTALMNTYARAYHVETRKAFVYEDPTAASLIYPHERELIEKSLADMAGCFDPHFKGGGKTALSSIMDTQLSPAPLARAAFTQMHLQNAAKLNTAQYLALGSGLSIFSLNNAVNEQQMNVIDVDLECNIADTLSRIARSSIPLPQNCSFVTADLSKEGLARVLHNSYFNSECITFCSIEGLSFKLVKNDFKNLILDIAAILPAGSAICFDYGDELALTERASKRMKRHRCLAAAYGEAINSCYSFEEMEKLLEECGLLIYEHITPADVQRLFFDRYNALCKERQMTAFENINCCLAVKFK